MVDKTFFPRLKTRAEFEKWLVESENNMQNYFATLSEEYCKTLDMSFDSIVSLTDIIFYTYVNLKAAYTPEGIQTLDGVGRYVSNAFMHHLGGEWTIILPPSRDAYMGYAGITKFKNAPESVSSRIVYPQFWVTAMIERPDPDYVTRVFKGY